MNERKLRQHKLYIRTLDFSSNYNKLQDTNKGFVVPSRNGIFWKRQVLDLYNFYTYYNILSFYPIGVCGKINYSFKWVLTVRCIVFSLPKYLNYIVLCCVGLYSVMKLDSVRFVLFHLVWFGFHFIIMFVPLVTSISSQQFDEDIISHLHTACISFEPQKFKRFTLSYIKWFLPRNRLYCSQYFLRALLHLTSCWFVVFDFTLSLISRYMLTHNQSKSQCKYMYK